MQEWTVTRQAQWPTGARFVEISAGGLDYTNPDALSQKYPHEFETFDDCRKAAAAAIEIARAWARDSGNGVSIGYGFTHGMTMPFEEDARVYPSSASRGLIRLRRWAAEEYERAPKCEECGEVLPEHYITLEDDDARYCRERCADRAWERMMLGAEDYN